MLDFLLSIITYIIPTNIINNDNTYKSEKFIIESTFIKDFNIENYNNLVDYYNKYNNITN